MTFRQCNRCLWKQGRSCVMSDAVIEYDIDPATDPCPEFHVFHASITHWTKKMLIKKASAGGVSADALQLMDKMTLENLRILFLRKGRVVLRGSYRDPARRRHTQMYHLDWDFIEEWSKGLEAETCGP